MPEPFTKGSGLPYRDVVESTSHRGRRPLRQVVGGFLHHGYLIMGALSIAGQFAATFKEFPPRQKAASFIIDDALAKMGDAASGAGH